MTTEPPTAPGPEEPQPIAPNFGHYDTVIGWYVRRDDGDDLRDPDTRRIRDIRFDCQ